MVVKTGVIRGPRDKKHCQEYNGEKQTTESPVRTLSRRTGFGSFEKMPNSLVPFFIFMQRGVILLLPSIQQLHSCSFFSNRL